MKIYLAMCLEGKDTIPARKIMLAKKQSELRQKISALNDAINFIDWKQNFYDEVLSGKIEYKSNFRN